MKFLYFFAKRFIAGQDVIEMLKNIRYIGNVTINYVGESCTKIKKILKNIDEYEKLIYHLKRGGGRRKPYEISIKLSQFGNTKKDWTIAIDRLLKAIDDTPITLKMDMECSSMIEGTLEIAKYYGGKVGVVLQANMRRSKDDLPEMLKRDIPVRICKGAYTGDFKKEDDIRKAYIELASRAIQYPLEPAKHIAFATHDEYLIDIIKSFNCKEDYYFEMLYGIRRDLMQELHIKDYNVRTYVPYGERWFPYVCRRLMEFKNMKFIISNIIREKLNELRGSYRGVGK